MVAIHYYSFARWLRLGIAYISADEATFQLPTQSVVFFYREASATGFRDLRETYFKITRCNNFVL